MRAILFEILSAEDRKGETKRQTTHVDAYIKTLRDAGSIPAASTRSVPQGVWGKYSPMPSG